MEVVWQVPPANWLKVNIDGVVRVCPGLASYVGVLRERWGEYVDSFSAFLRV